MIREKHSVPASTLTTFKLGGNASIVYEPSTLDSLSGLIIKLDRFYILGNGSNVVFSDDGIELPIIHLSTEFAHWRVVDTFPEQLLLEDSKVLDPARYDDIKILAFAAMPIMRLSSELTNLSFTGLEFAAGIPGTIGGAVAMNAGAHGNEISEVIDSVYIMNKQGIINKISKEKLNFKYRSADITGLIIAVGLNLARADRDLVIAKRRSCLDYRKSTQPLTLPSAGSVFVNVITPNSEIKHAATLLESVGMKGERIGGVEFSSLHSNWIVKVAPEGKTSDLINLISKAKARVKEKYGIELSTEIKFWP